MASLRTWAAAAQLALTCCLVSITAAHGQQPQPQLDCSSMLGLYKKQHPREALPYTDPAKQMVYFLHVPRTAGRTFHTCLLKAGTPPNRRCPKAYDHLRLNMTLPRCHLLSSHDDFSVVSMLPDNVAVLTHLRDPLDRFLSAYEFAVEVAARMLTRPANFRKRADKVATEDVWPWSYLVPFFQADITARMEVARKQPQPEGGKWVLVQHPDGDEYYYNKVLGVSKWNVTEVEQQDLLPSLDAYDNPLVMPLREFAAHPIAKELLHDGQLFQVLGVTNYSHWNDAGDLRACFWQDATLQSGLLEFAQARIQRFMHVGATDRLLDSVRAAAVAMKFELWGDAYGGGDDDAAQQPAQQEQAAGATKPAASAADLPELADKVRDARFKLQSAQRELFRATQFHTSDQEMGRLKEQVATLRQQLRDLQDQLLAARAQLPTSTDKQTDSKAQVEEANNARRLPGTLGVEYQRCAQRAQSRNLQRRDNSLINLAMPDGRTVVFNKHSRTRIPDSVLQEIRQLNQADIALHKAGLQILDHNLAAWKAEGTLEELPHVAPLRLTPRLSSRKWNIPKPQADNAGELKL